MFQKNDLKGLAVVTALSILISPFAYSLIEAEAASAVTDAVVVTLTVDSAISITSPADTAMSQSIGLTTDTATASTTWNVKTSDTDGYTLAVAASTDPAMQSAGDTIFDYTEGTPGTPETWSVASGAAEFGFSARGDRVSTGTYGTDSDCLAGDNHTPSATLNYRGFDGTNTISVATHSATTTASGDDTTVCYAVEQNGVFIPSGTYTATITATALVQ